MKDIINIEMVDNDYIVRGEGFSQVMEDRDVSVNIQLGNYLHDLIYRSMNQDRSCKVKIEINITNAE